MSLKTLLKSVIPTPLLSWYHRVVAVLAVFVYRHPSRRMVVIGITGTKGKSTTANLLWHALTAAGHTVGLAGTLNISLGKVNALSPYKQTMLGRFRLQRLLHQMVQHGCDMVIVETTSEGIKQWRHSGIHYDVCVFTNLTPEHLDAHGGFEAYKEAKVELFRHLGRLPNKQLNGVAVPKITIVNSDDPHSAEILAIGDWQKVRVGTHDSDVVMSEVNENAKGLEFTLNEQQMSVPLAGTWNARNAALAAAVAQTQGVTLSAIAETFSHVPQVPGRMEFIDEGQPFSVVVDYAYEPVSLTLLYESCRKRVGTDHKLITLISSTGGGRDVWRRSENGKVAATYCDYVIVTNEDPYGDDPQEIIDQVAQGVMAAGKTEGQTFWRVSDRRAAIEKAIALAQPGDVVMLTAKGAEQKMMVGDEQSISWDDRQVVRDILQS